jgi:hypothetical protein
MLAYVVFLVFPFRRPSMRAELAAAAVCRRTECKSASSGKEATKLNQIF